MKLSVKLATLAALASLIAALVAGFSGSARADGYIIQPVLKPNLVVSATGTKVTVWNKGYVSAGPFKVAISAGYRGDTCNYATPAYSVDVAGLAAGGWTTITLEGSSIPRTAYADFLNAVTESNELDNSAVIPSVPVIC